MINKTHFDEKKIQSDISELQNYVKAELGMGKSIDDILYNTDKFEKYEKILKKMNLAFLLTVLNTFKSKIIIDMILDSVRDKIEQVKY